MSVRSCIVIVALSSSTGCASAPLADDRLCGPLRDFAKSVGRDDVRSIAFHTSSSAKECIHGDYSPAEAVCEYLIHHGAVEFAGNNVERALSCLSPETNFGPDIDVSRGVFHIGYGTPDQDSHITVEFAEDADRAGMVLRIKADGY